MARNVDHGVVDRNGVSFQEHGHGEQEGLVEQNLSSLSPVHEDGFYASIVLGGTTYIPIERSDGPGERVTTSGLMG